MYLLRERSILGLGLSCSTKVWWIAFHFCINIPRQISTLLQNINNLNKIFYCIGTYCERGLSWPGCVPAMRRAWRPCPPPCGGSACCSSCSAGSSWSQSQLREPAAIFRPLDSDHRVGRVLSFPELGLPQPLTRSRVCPPLGSGGRGTLTGDRGGGKVPIPTRGHTLWYSLYSIYLLCDSDATIFQKINTIVTQLTCTVFLPFYTPNKNLIPRPYRADFCNYAAFNHFNVSVAWGGKAWAHVHSFNVRMRKLVLFAFLCMLEKWLIAHALGGKEIGLV